MVKVKDFGTTKEGKLIRAFTLDNGKGVEATVIERGATLISLIAPDKDGNKADIVLGYDSLEPYLTNDFFFGATVGRSANRIANASFELDGETFKLQENDGPNNLHTHLENGFHRRDWEGKADENSDSVTFFIEEEDGFTLFPGKLEMTVTYSLTADNELVISYHGVCDRSTVINCTNHSYFNLAGHDSGNIHDQFMQINASGYVPVVAGAIPTGEVADVTGTPFDLRQPVRIGDRVDGSDEQLLLVNGYDHNFCPDGSGMREMARAEDRASGRTITVISDLPGIQFYAGNMIGDHEGKGGAHYGKRSGFCLETQFYPDSINQPKFEKPVFGAGKEYKTTTVYKLGVL